jgi:hypothetical protein
MMGIRILGAVINGVHGPTGYGYRYRPRQAAVAAN